MEGTKKMDQVDFWKARATKWRRAFHALADGGDYTPSPTPAKKGGKKHSKRAVVKKKKVTPAQLLFSL